MTPKKIFLVGLATVMLAACGSDDDSDDANNAAKIGVFLDSPVIGIDYTSPSHSGKTNAMGQFNFKDGEKVTFSIGDIILPEAIARTVVHVSTLFNTDVNDLQVINLARLLLSLDADKNPDNGISIPDQALSMTQGLSIDFSSATFEADVSNFIANAGGSVSLVSSDDALAHIKDTLEEANNLTSQTEDRNNHGCDSECVDRASYHEGVINFSPRHQQVNVSTNPSVTIRLSDEITVSDKLHIELFGVNNSIENCRIDWPGFHCGSLSSIDSHDLLDGIINDDPATAKIIFGNASMTTDNTFNFTLDKTLTPGISYVVHIFGDSSAGEFKTWWIFKT